MPTLSYAPAWWIPGPHLRTLWGKFLRRQVRIPTRSVQWDTPDGDFLELVRLDAPEASPRILILHGLEGGSRSHYARGLMAEAARRGWGADLLIFRSCGSEINRTPRFYHSGETGDLAFAVDRIVDEFPESRLLLAGVSLGGNVLLKFLGERGNRTPSRIVAAAAVSVPYDLARSSRRIGHGFSRVYQTHFLRSLQRKAALKHATFPDRLPGAARLRARTLYEFDDVVTAPLHGFSGADEYYSKSSAIRWLTGITVPTLLLSARDDPFLPEDVLGEVESIASDVPALQVEFVNRGGHVGFIGGRVPWRPLYYAERRLGEFFAQQLAAGRTSRAARVERESPGQ